MSRCVLKSAAFVPDGMELGPVYPAVGTSGLGGSVGFSGIGSLLRLFSCLQSEEMGVFW